MFSHSLDGLLTPVPVRDFDALKSRRLKFSNLEYPPVGLFGRTLITRVNKLERRVRRTEPGPGVCVFALDSKSFL